jgi:1,4-alpha-glucan branching enzyme
MTRSLSRDAIAAIVAGQHGDPFSVLGPHEVGGRLVVRAYVPGARAVELVTRDGELLTALARRHDGGFFEGILPERTRYLLRASNDGGSWTIDDPYAYAPVLGAMDDWLLGEGTHVRLYDRLGAHAIVH